MLNGSHHKALGIAKVLFEEEGYHTRFLQEIVAFICKPEFPLTQTITNGYTIKPHGFRSQYEVYAQDGELVCITLYKKGAVEAMRRLNLSARA